MTSVILVQEINAVKLRRALMELVQRCNDGDGVFGKHSNQGLRKPCFKMCGQVPRELVVVGQRKSAQSHWALQCRGTPPHGLQLRTPMLGQEGPGLECLGANNWDDGEGLQNVFALGFALPNTSAAILGLVCALPGTEIPFGHLSKV